jgi:hypothetical protein
MPATIDLRAFDAHHQGLTFSQHPTDGTADPELAQRIRDAMRAQGMRVPLTTAEEDALFDEADRRFRGQA